MRLLRKGSSSEPLKLCYFQHPKNHPGKYNFGDLLSHQIVEKVLNQTVDHSSPKDADLFAIGSIMAGIRKANGAAVWGTGIMFEGQEWGECSNIDFLAVRGHLSAEQLGIENDDLAFGDPALLCSKYFRRAWRRKYRLGVIPHYVDQNHPLVRAAREADGVHVIDVFDSPDQVCKQISQCQEIVSSSLHGIIVAHSYSIPAGWIELSDKVAGAGFKFRDYYSVFNRQPDEIDPDTVIAGELEARLWAPTSRQVQTIAQSLALRLQSYWGTHWSLSGPTP